MIISTGTTHPPTGSHTNVHCIVIPSAEFLSTVSRHDEAVEQRILAAELAPKDYALVVSAATALRMAERKTEAESWYRLVSSSYSSHSILK